MIARPPTFRARKPRATNLSSGLGGWQTQPKRYMAQKVGGSGHVPSMGPAVPPVPTSDAPPPTPQTAPPAGPPPHTPPPETLQGAQGRIESREQYGITEPDINRQLMLAAAHYGGAPNVIQYGLGPGGEDTQYNAAVTADPNSVLAGLGRTLQTGTTSLNEDLNNRNSYFSGAHLKGQQDLIDENNRQRLQAQADYEDAVNRLMTGILQARHDRQTGLSAADLADFQSAAASEPQAEDSSLLQAAAAPAAPAAAPVAARAAAPVHRTARRTGHRRR